MADNNFLIADLFEAKQGDVSQSEEDILDEAHKLFHLRMSGPLPWDTQVAIVVLSNQIKEASRPKQKVASE